MAAELFRARIQEDPAFRGVDIVVASAGLDAHEGALAAESAQRVLKARGLSVEDHRSQRFDRRFAEFDLILVMTEQHKTRILLEWPETAANVFTLREYAGIKGENDIEDPFMQGDEAYERAYKSIDEAVTKAVERLRKAIGR